MKTKVKFFLIIFCTLPILLVFQLQFQYFLKIKNSNIPDDSMESCIQRVRNEFNQQKLQGNKLFNCIPTELTRNVNTLKVIEYDNPSNSKSFMSDVETRLEETDILFPGWVNRIFTHILPDTNIIQLICGYKNLIWCMAHESSGDLLPVWNNSVHSILPFKAIHRSIEHKFTLKQRIDILKEYELKNLTEATLLIT